MYGHFFFNLQPLSENWPSGLRRTLGKRVYPKRVSGVRIPHSPLFLFMSIRNIIALILILASLVCLYPGLVKPILSINIGVDLPILGSVSLHDTKQSIMGTIKTLHQNNNSLVAFLILLFSVIVPVIKAIALLLVIFIKKLAYRHQLSSFVALISKWSMADVFVVGIMLAFLATRSDDNIEAQLHEGFYYFLAYCIVSIVASQLVKVKLDERDISTI